MSILSVTNKRLPDFKVWIEEHAPGCQADGFESFADLALRTQGMDLEHLTENEASFARMWMGACVAAVELCNMEALKHDRSPEQIVATLPRVFAAAAMYAMASACKPGVPYRKIAKVLTDEFKIAALRAAQELQSDQEQATS